MGAGTRIGVLGGTFDPPHTGHLIVASAAFEALALERLLFVPAAVPPHKIGRVSASPAQRLEMVRRAIAGDDRFRAEDLELRRAGASYTVDTLRELRARDPEAEIFFLMGVDQLRELDSWREPDEVARLARLVVLSRSGEQSPGGGRYPATGLDVPRIDIAATQIRRTVAAGGEIRYLVPDAVREYIARAGLYRGEPAA